MKRRRPKKIKMRISYTSRLSQLLTHLRNEQTPFSLLRVCLSTQFKIPFLLERRENSLTVTTSLDRTCLEIIMNGNHFLIVLPSSRLINSFDAHIFLLSLMILIQFHKRLSTFLTLKHGIMRTHHM